MTLDILEPTEKSNHIGLILVSSGSWNSRKSDIVEEEENRRQKDHWTQGLLKGGFTLFVVRHGSSPRYSVPEMTPDILRSVRFVRANAARFSINPDRIGITSGSSGGHLALMAATQGDDGNPDSKDPIAPVEIDESEVRRIRPESEACYPRGEGTVAGQASWIRFP